MAKIRLGSILGTTITVDPSFLFLCALFVVMDADRFGVLFALLWVPVLFISVLFHELAHAAMIGIFGFGPSQIVLQGVGGVTINERRARPWQDVLISAAGPASTYLLAWLAALLFTRVAFARGPVLADLLPFLATVNILWAKLNLMPVAPLDGYGIVRNSLRMFLNERLAFAISIWISLIVGVVLVVILAIRREYFLVLLLIWLIRSSYAQWQFFRSIDRTHAAGLNSPKI